MNSILQDLRYGLKSLLSTPRLTFAALASIALGIGSAVFMFTLVNAILLKGVPFPDADRLARIWTVSNDSQETDDISYLDSQDIRKASTSFEAIETVARTRMSVMTDDGTERVRGESVTPGYFQMIGIKPAKGRFFTPEEYAPNGNRVIVIGNDLWKRKYGGRAETFSARWSERAARREGTEPSSTPSSASCPPASSALWTPTLPNSGCRPSTSRRGASARGAAHGFSGLSPA